MWSLPPPFKLPIDSKNDETGFPDSAPHLLVLCKSRRTDGNPVGLYMGLLIVSEKDFLGRYLQSLTRSLSHGKPHLRQL